MCRPVPPAPSPRSFMRSGRWRAPRRNGSHNWSRRRSHPVRVRSVVSRFLRSLLGGREPQSRELQGALAELNALAAARPALASPAAVLREVLSNLQANPVAVTVPTLSDAVSHAKLSAGMPLLRGETLTVDIRALQQRCAAVCAVVENHEQRDAIRRVATSLAPHELLNEILAGRPDAVAARADTLGL